MVEVQLTVWLTANSVSVVEPCSVLISSQWICGHYRLPLQSTCCCPPHFFKECVHDSTNIRGIHAYATLIFVLQGRYGLLPHNINAERCIYVSNNVTLHLRSYKCNIDLLCVASFRCFAEVVLISVPFIALITNSAVYVTVFCTMTIGPLNGRIVM